MLFDLFDVTINQMSDQPSLAYWLIKIFENYYQVVILLSNLYLFSRITKLMSTDKEANTLHQPIRQSSPQNTQQLFFSLIERLGSFGRYQKITIVLWCFIIFLCGELLFSMPFLFYQDPYDCSSLSPSIDCKEFVCSLSAQSRIKYIPQPTIHSIANQLGDFRCPEERSTIDSLIAIMFFGIAVGYFLMTLFGEIVGKKALILLNFSCFIFGIGLVLLFYSNQVIVTIGLFIAVLGISNSYIICFMFIAETVESHARQKYTALIQSLYATGIAVNILLFWLLKDWWIIFLVGYLIPAIIAFSAICLLVVDTPMSLIIRNSSEKALQKLAFIAQLNRTNPDFKNTQLDQLRQRYHSSAEKTKSQKITIIDIFRYPSTRSLTLLLMLLQATISFQFHAPSLMINSFHFSMYINGLAISLSQILANFTASFVISRFRRRRIGFACFGCTLISATTLIFVWDQNSNDSNISKNLVILVLVFLLQFAITKQYCIYYVYLNEVVPTQARMISVSLVGLTGGLASTSASGVIGICLDNGFPVMVVFAILSGVCILIVIYLPQTFKQVPQEMIKQLQGKIRRSRIQGEATPSLIQS